MTSIRHHKSILLSQPEICFRTKEVVKSSFGCGVLIKENWKRKNKKNSGAPCRTRSKSCWPGSQTNNKPTGNESKLNKSLSNIWLCMMPPTSKSWLTILEFLLSFTDDDVDQFMQRSYVCNYGAYDKMQLLRFGKMQSSGFLQTRWRCNWGSNYWTLLMTAF